MSSKLESMVAAMAATGILVAACSSTSAPSASSASSSASPASAAVPPAGVSIAGSGPRLDPTRIDDGDLVTLKGNTHPKARPGSSVGRLPGSTPLEYMQLVLKRSPEQETALETTIDALHDPTSAVYQKWIPAERFGATYGVAESDLQTIRAWLESRGFRVDHVPPSRMFIEFSGTAAQVESAFHTEMDALVVKGERHFGNMRDPQIPAELAKVVVGVHALHDFMPHAMHKSRGTARRSAATGGWSMVDRSPSFTMPSIGACVQNSDCTSGTCDTTTGACTCTSATQCKARASGAAAACTNGECVGCASNADCVFPATCNTTTKVCDETFYAVAPADFATIYNLNPLFAEGITGKGETVVVLEDTVLKTTADVATFRSAFGLSSYTGTFSQVTATGKAATCAAAKANGAEGEAALDADWAGAAAPDAAIELAACNDTSTVFGGLIALENLINGTSPPPIVSMSYGECEFFNGTAANQSFSNTYQQAAAAGVSVFVSAGDEAAASCDADEASATQGISVSGFASTPYNVAVGGTDFMDTYNRAAGGPALSTFWGSTVSAASPYGSALSYIPEIPWNDSCASKVIYSTPSLTLGSYTEAYGAGGFCNSTLGAASFQTTGAGSGGPSNYATAPGEGWPQPAWQTGVVGLPTKSGGVRYLPDVSLFAANGVWGHFYVFCMTDTKEGGGPCTYTSAADTLALAAGGTSFASPAMAGIQALIDQKMGGPQGNPNYTYYKLAAAEQGARGSARCNASSASSLPASGCIFNDVTQGDIVVNCGQTACTASTSCPYYSASGYPNQTCSGGVCVDTCATSADCPQVGQTCTGGQCTPGAVDCYQSTGGTVQGALSTSTSTYSGAYSAGTGWDYATGLGTVNAYNLVHAWSE